MYKRTGKSVKPTNKNVDTIPSSGRRKQLSVAGYCRVSTKDESQETSIENQRIHYQHYIESNPDWKLAGIYWETGVSGTSAEARPELQRLLADCRAGRVDMVVTKSISRFSRNTTDCLALVRELSALGVTLFFEKENLRTDEMGSEFFLSILAALSQEESRSISGNMKWAIRKRFRDGTYKGGKAPYGYRKTADSRYMIEPEEAAVVRRIFSALCGGMSSAAVAKRLNDAGIPTWSATHGQGDAAWSGNRIRQIAKNRFYVGDAIYQKTYTDDCYHQHPNHGELDIYLSENAHPAIVDRDTFAEVNAAIERNAEKYGRAKAGNRRANRYCSSGKFFCGVCGGKMYRSGGHQRDYICQAHARGGQCPMPQVPEKDILNAFVTLLNKLVFALRRGLPFPATEEADRNELQRIDDALSENQRRWDALYDRIQAQRHTPALLEERAALEHEARLLLDRRDRLSFTDGTEELRRRVEHRDILPAAEPSDEEIFRSFVTSVIVRKGEWVEFRFTYGLCLRESLRRPAKNKALPIYTEFILAPGENEDSFAAGEVDAAVFYDRIVPLRQDEKNK